MKMKMTRILLVSLLNLVLFTANGQQLDEDVKILDAPGGEALFELDAETEIYAFPAEDGWHKLRRVVYVAAASVVDSATILAGTPLQNEEGDELGKTIAELEVVDGRFETGFRSKGRFIAAIEGYVFRTKLADGSIVEKRLEELLDVRNATERQDGLEELYDDFGFEEREFGEFTAHVLREKHTSSAAETDFRLILIMKGETRPYAVLSNKHKNIKPEKIKDEWERGSYRAIYFYKPREDQRTLIQDEILYTFLAL